MQRHARHSNANKAVSAHFANHDIAADTDDIAADTDDAGVR
jgi:hypothetical protein